MRCNDTLSVINECSFHDNCFLSLQNKLVLLPDEECLSRKTSMARVNNQYAYVDKKNSPCNLLLDTLYGSVITSSCYDISHFSDVEYDKYVSRLSYVRKKNRINYRKREK